MPTVEPEPTPGDRHGLRPALTMSLTVCAALAAVGVPVDAMQLLDAGRSVPVAASAGAVLVSGAALVGFLAGFISLPLGLLPRPRNRWLAVTYWALWTLAAWAVCMHLIEPAARVERLAYEAIAATAALAMFAGAWLGSAQPRGLARACAGAIAAAALVADIWLEPSIYPEFHDLAYLVLAVALTGALSGLRSALATLPLRSLALVQLAALLAAGVVLAGVDHVLPGWRDQSIDATRHMPRLLRALRAPVDLDGDGFSAVLWGGDCSDLDPQRSPVAADVPGDGIDANCNGVDAPLEPSDSARGLAPPVGDPARPLGERDLVVLVTLDTARAELLSPDIMPRLFAWSQRGLRLDAHYSSGTGTYIAMPTVLKASIDAPSVPSILRAHGIDSAAIGVIGVRFTTFGMRDITSRGRTARERTDAALATVAAAGEQPLLLWLHYYDLHDRLGASADSGKTRQRYLESAESLDLELDRLISTLAQQPRWSRTLVIVTADHGEALGEAGMIGHGRSALDVVIRTPAMVLAPGLTPGTYSGLTSLRDVPATVLGAFGLAAEARQAERFGRSWLRLWHDRQAPLHDFVVVRSGRYASGRATSTTLAIAVSLSAKLVLSVEEQVVQRFDRLAASDRAEEMLPPDDHTTALGRALAIYCDLAHIPN